MKIREYLIEFNVDYVKFAKSIQEEIDRELIIETTVSGNVGTYDVPHASGKSYVRVDIPPAQRSFKNLPRDSKKKPKVKFQDWLGLKGNGSQSTNGKFYGWTHRGIFGFKKGQEVKSNDHIGRDRKRKCPYKIKNDKDAKAHAIRFMKELS